MSLQVAPFESETDIDAFVRVETAAFHEDVLTPVLWPEGRSPAATTALAAQNRKSFREDKNTHWLKVADGDIGEVIACAMFIVQGGRTDEDMAKALSVPEALPGESPKAKEIFYGRFWRIRDEIMGKRPHYLLCVLETHPDHHRRGAGSLLLKAITEQADKAGLETYLEGTPAGRPLYERFGFKPVQDLTYDLTEFGLNGIVRHSTAMVRPPQDRSC